MVSTAVIAAVVALLACSEGALEPAPITAVNDANARWQALALTSYRVDVRQECFCSPDDQKWYEVRVVNNSVREVWPLEPINPEISRRPHFPTISEVYGLLAAAPQPPTTLFRGEFDPRTGLPLRVWLGYPSANDSGVYYEFRNLRAGTSQQ